MNENKSSPWRLCPSKRFPGKFYYYNVLSGEAAWCFNDSEKKFPKKDEKLERVDKSHSYPEPHSTPENQSLSNSISLNKSYFPNRLCQSTFGIAVFPKYFSSQSPIIPNVFTPVPQMVAKPLILDSKPQTPDTKISVQASEVPLSKRFGSYKSLSTDTFNSIPETLTSNTFDHEKGHVDDNITDKSKLVMKKPVLNLNALSTNIDNRKRILPSSQILTDRPTTPRNSVENTKTSPVKGNPFRKLKLDSNDLRYELEAKRRKIKEIGCGTRNKEQFVPDTSKKRVTFNLGNSEDNISTFSLENSNGYGKINTETSELSQKLRSLKKLSVHNVWYILVDLDVMLDDYAFIEDLVLSDEDCKLLIPERLKCHIKNMCIGEQSGNNRMAVARKIYRLLATWKRHIHIQPDDNIQMDTVKDMLLHCGLREQENGYCVVIITTDPDLYLKAKICKIYVFMLDEIKNLTKRESDFLNDINKTTTKEKHENLFLQSTKDFDPFALSRNRENKIVFDPKLTKTRTIFRNVNLQRSIDNNSTKEYSDEYDISYEIRKRTEKLNLTDDIEVSDIRFKPISIADTNKKEIQIIASDQRRTMIKNKNWSNSKNEQNSTILNSKFDLNGNITDNFFGDNLRRFTIKNESMKEKVKLRLDEYICWFSQVMENFINDIIQEKHDLTLLTFYFGLRIVKNMYGDQLPVIEIVDRICELGNFCRKNGNIKLNINPSDLMKTIGYCFILTVSFKSILEADHIKETTQALEDILADMERTTEFELNEPSFARISMSEFEDSALRRNFVKDQSEIIQYLRKHYPVWRGCEPELFEQLCNERKEPQIIRTSGKHPIKINNTKEIFIEKTNEDKPNHKSVKTKPTVNRNFNVVEKFEEKLKITQQNEDILSIIFNEDNDIESTVIISAKDSGFDDGQQIYQLIRCFLIKLSRVFKTIYKFVEEFANQYKDVSEEEKKRLYDISNETHKRISVNIDHLKSIIERESLEGNSLKTLLIKNGYDASEDKRVTRYRQVITKCLEQASVLENSLNVIMHLTNENCPVPLTPANYEMTYFNIFE